MCANLLHLQEELALLERAGFDYIHLDIMDGHYVPNLTFGPDFCRSLAEGSSVKLDLHFMVERVDELLDPFLKALRAGQEARADGFAAPLVSFHPESCWHPHRTIQHIAALGATPALAFSPAVPVEHYASLLGEVGSVLVMTVNPGYSGQKLIPWTLTKVERLVELREQHDYAYEIAVDGNVSWENIPKMLAAGADILVAGSSSLFGARNQRASDIARLQELLDRSTE
jgi:ribulose-phosphate 3-epimerase